VTLDAHRLRGDLPEFGFRDDPREFLRVFERVNRIETIAENQGWDLHRGPRLPIRMRPVHNEAFELNGGFFGAGILELERERVRDIGPFLPRFEILGCLPEF